MNNPYMGHASQLLDLHQESLARFEAVILSQRLVGGWGGEKNPLYVHRGTRVQCKKKEAKKREEKEEGQEGEAGEEVEEVEGGVTSLPHRAAHSAARWLRIRRQLQPQPCQEQL